MRRIFYLQVIICFFSFSAMSQVTYQFQNYSMGGPITGAFTTNNFRCIGVGKSNIIWAGSQYGGLYMYDGRHNTWTKSSKLTNVFINDIKADADSGIWIAQSGTSSGAVHSNLAGGVNHFRLDTDQVMDFYTVTDSSLSSRNARALYLDPAFRASEGKIPRAWVALSTFITSGTSTRGAINVGLNAESPYFTRLLSGMGLTTTLICESVAGNSDEVWVGTRFNGIGGSNTGSKIVRFRPDKSYIGQYDATNTPTMLQPGFSAQAMLFDSRRDKWIGLKQGGLRILAQGEWFAMNSSQFFDAGTQVNYNAMTEDEFGNIYIGTTAGLLVYEVPAYPRTSSPNDPGNYKMLTTVDGLVNNNVTGLAYDKKNGKVLITTTGGISFLKIRYPNIHGIVQDVYTNIEGTGVSSLQKKPFETLGRVRVYLLKDGEEKEMVYPEADGTFTLKEADETSVYTVEVKHNEPGKTIRYIYNDIKNHTRLKPTLIPDSLIGEIEAIIPKLKQRCFPVKLTFGVEIADLICTAEGFFTNGYDAAYDWVYDPEGVKTDHEKRVNNLANYYGALAAVYNLGGQSTDLISETSGVLMDVIESIAGEFNVQQAIKDADISSIFAAAGETEQVADATAKLTSSFKDAIVYVINKTLIFVKNEDIKKILEQMINGLNEAADLVIEANKGGKGDAFKKALKDNVKRIIATAITSTYYDKYYAQTNHEYFVPQTSLAARNNKSSLTYEEAYEKLYSPITPSLVKLATDTVKYNKEFMATLGNAAKVADAVNTMAEITSWLGVLPGGQAIAAAARAVSIASKAMKYLLVGGSILVGANGTIDVVSLSDSIQKDVQLERYYESLYNTSYSNTAIETSIDSLMARKIRYNQKLTELQPIYAAASFDVNTFKTKRSQLKVQDSLFSVELKNVLNSIVSVSDTAGDVIPGFTERYDHVADSFVNFQAVLKKAYHYRNLAYIAESDKSLDRAGIDSLIVDLKLTNDSIVAGLQGLLNEISSYNINAKAFLQQENYAINFSRVPGTNGTITYSFKNYGGEPQNNVSFKITDVKGGYTILGADSVNVGTILAGQTKSVTYTFKSPMHDSLSHYRIAVKASNGRFQDATGSFYAIDPSKCYSLKDGNWNDPATWSCGVVPGATNKVYIMHKVTVTANVTCKDITLGQPGDLKVNTGIILNILK